MLRSVSPSRAGTSYIPSSAYNSRFGRVPTQAISGAAVYDSQDRSRLVSQAPGRARSEFGWSSTAPSTRPGRPGGTWQPRLPPQSRIEREPRRAFEPQPSSFRPVIQSSSSKASSKALAGSPKPPSTTPKSVTAIRSPAHPAPNTHYNHTKAPPADKAGPDLDEILSQASEASISKLVSPPGGTVFPGMPQKYKPLVSRRSDAASKSKPKKPGAASEARAEGLRSRQSQLSSRPEVGRRSEVRRSEI
jgi:hypothetical protein